MPPEIELLCYLYQMVSGHLHVFCGKLSVHVCVISPCGLCLTTPLALGQCDFGSTFPLISGNGLRSHRQWKTPKDMASGAALFVPLRTPGPGVAPFLRGSQPASPEQLIERRNTRQV